MPAFSWQSPTLHALLQWVDAHQALVWWVTAVSATLTIGTLVAMPWVVSLIPDDYFATRERPPIVGRSERPVARWAARIGKNLLGVVLILFGLVMSVPLVPGQGTIVALAGLLLVEFPGKRRLELWLIRRRGVLRVINWLRHRRGRPPLIVWTPAGPKRLHLSAAAPQQQEPAPAPAKPPHRQPVSAEPSP